MSDRRESEFGDRLEDKPKSGETPFSQQIGEQAARKLRAQRHVSKTIWTGLGMIGLVGWSVAIPTLTGAAIGVWLDRNYPGEHSWTLAMLAIGLGLGCYNAWRWIAKEDSEIHRQDDDNHE